MNGSTAPRWVYVDNRAHVLADGDGVPAYLTVCGLGVAATATVYTVSPSLDVCRVCVPLPGDDEPSTPDPLDVPPPTFPSTPTVF